MALPNAYAPLSASMIMVEAGQSADAVAFLSGPTSTPAAGSMVKLYDSATKTPVNQNAPHAYSEFYSKTFVSGGGSLTAFMGKSGTSTSICGDSTLTFLWHDGSGNVPQNGDIIYDNSSGGSSNIVASVYVGWDNTNVPSTTVNRIGQTNSSGVLGFSVNC